MSPSQTPSSRSTFRLRRRTPGSFILVPCPQEGRSLRCQGHLEADAALTLSACARVVRIQEQPFPIWYAWRPTDTGCQICLLSEPPVRRPRATELPRISYVLPDFLVDLDNGPKHLLEVKLGRRLAHPVVQRKLAVGRLYAERQGWVFHVLTEAEIRRGFLLTNLRLLRRYRLLTADCAITDQLAAHVPATGTRLGDLLQRTAPAGPLPVLYAHVLHMLEQGFLSFDPYPALLDLDSILFPKGAITWDPFGSAWAPSGCSTSGSTASCVSPPPINSLPST